MKKKDYPVRYGQKKKRQTMEPLENRHVYNVSHKNVYAALELLANSMSLLGENEKIISWSYYPDTRSINITIEREVDN